MTRLAGAWMSALCGLVVSGCQPEAARESVVANEIQGAMAEAIASQPPPAPPPEAVTSALLPSISVDPGRLEDDLGQRFQISVKEAPAQQFFMSLVDGTPYNMVVHPEVDGLVTLTLKNVTILDVMEVLRDVYGYEYRSTRRGLEVLPRRLRTRVFEVDYLNMRREGSSQTRVSSGQVTQAADQITENSGDDDEFDGRARRSTDDRASRVTGTEINTIQPATSFWGEIHTSVKAILGGAEGRKVVVNPQSGMVVVRAMPNELREVEEFLITAQAIARRQVILEAKIIEVRLDDGFQQGINWAAMLEPGDDKSVTVGQVGRGSILRNDNTLVPATAGNLDPRNFLPLLGPAAGALGGIFTVALALSDFNAFVQILDTQGTVHVLSNPRIATLNNQKAVIKVGSDEFFVTDISNTIVAGVSTTTTPSVELTPFFSGIALDVTPQISADGEVLLHIHPAISRVQDQQKIVTLGEVTQSIPLALSTVRESDSVVRARSGQVVVIGGLMESISEDETSDSPVSAAPVVGGLFSDKRERLAKSELVILLRPLIVENGRQWTEAIQQSSNTIEDLERAAGQPGRWGQRRD